MAVGAGSIKRAAKANLETSGKVEQVQKETVKKSSGKKAGNVAKKASVKEEKNTEINQVCHITEDLPIYLL